MTAYLNAEKTRQLMSTIDKLYEAACEPERWPAFLRSASTLFETQGAQIGHHDIESYDLSFSRVFGYEWDDDHYRRYDDLMPSDPRLAHFARHPFKPMHCRMIISDEKLHGSKVYKEVLSPGGVEYSMGVNLVEEQKSLSYFLALRNWNQPRFDDSDCALLGQLTPHLMRAIQLQRDFGSIDFERNISADTLDGMAVGILVTDKLGHIKYCNQTAREMMDQEDGLKEVNRSVAVTEDPAQTLLSCIRRVVGQAQTGHDTAGEPVSVARPSGKAPLAVLVSPIWRRHLQSGWVHARDPLAVIILRDPKRPAESLNEQLCRLYSLTASQARVACLIVDGQSLQQAAAKTGITEASARQYLKVVFEKMDVKRQGEMVIKALSLPLPFRTKQPEVLELR